MAGCWRSQRRSPSASSPQGGADRQFLAGKIASARFYADHILPQTLALARVVEKGAGSVIETDAELI